MTLMIIFFLTLKKYFNDKFINGLKKNNIKSKY